MPYSGRRSSNALKISKGITTIGSGELLWTWTLQESQRQADSYNCGLFLIRSIAHRINGEYPASIEDPLVERKKLVKGIAKEIGALLAPSPSPPPTVVVIGATASATVITTGPLIHANKQTGRTPI